MANKLVICGKEEQEVSLDSIKGLKIVIENGDNNQIKITEPYSFSSLIVKINGNSNSVEIGKNAVISNLIIDMGVTTNKRKLKINEFLHITDSVICLTESDSVVSIGKNCLIKSKCHIRCDDGHTIFDLDSGEVINRGGKVKIGNHVFIGQHTFIGKNVTISDNVVIFPCSVLVKSVEKKNVIVCGNPAKIVRENINFTI